MTSEHDYRNAVRYLQNLLNGGLMGARGTSALLLYGPVLQGGRRIPAPQRCSGARMRILSQAAAGKLQH